MRQHLSGIKAFIVPKRIADQETLVDNVLSWLGARLPPQQIPKYISHGEALPRNAMGKLTDWPVAHYNLRDADIVSEP